MHNTSHQKVPSCSSLPHQDSLQSFPGTHGQLPTDNSDVHVQASQSRVDPSLVDAFRRSAPSSPPKTPATPLQARPTAAANPPTQASSASSYPRQASPNTPLELNHLALSADSSPGPSSSLPQLLSNTPPRVLSTINEPEPETPPHAILASQNGDSDAAYATASASPQSSRDLTPARSNSSQPSPERSSSLGAMTSATQSGVSRKSPDSRGSVWPLPTAVASRIPKPQSRSQASSPGATRDSGRTAGRSGAGSRRSNSSSPPSWPQPPSDAVLQPAGRGTYLFF